MSRWLLLALAACGGSSGSRDANEPDGSGLVSLDKTPTSYRETCDGSGGLALSFTHFIDVNDEDEVARIYERAKPAAPVQQIALHAGLGVAAGDEADVEDLTRIGDRVFVTTSHARKTSGKLDRVRYRVGVFDVAGMAPAVSLTPVGSTGQLLDRMVDAANWDAPNAGVIAALVASSKLADDDEPSLAPEIAGANIEGLASDGTGKLLVGFRNPRPGDKALVVQVANPDALLTGARFGGVAELDLGGLGIRALAYSPVHQAVLIVAGSHAPGTVFKLYTWSGVLTAPATFVTDLVAPAGYSPEAVVPYPNTKDVQILFDGGDATIGGVGCKDAPVADRIFRDAIVTVE